MQEALDIRACKVYYNDGDENHKDFLSGLTLSLLSSPPCLRSLWTANGGSFFYEITLDTRVRCAILIVVMR